MNDAPAGKYGWATIDSDGDLQFTGQPGVKLRFYGANISTFMTHAQTDAVVNRLAGMGYNVVRVMAHDIMESWSLGIFNIPTTTNTNSLTFNTTSLDQLDYLFSRLKAKGIYVQMDVFTSFKLDSIPELANYGQSASLLLPLLPEAYSFWKKSVQMYLTHVNPYTNLALKDDPMVIGMCTWNENLLAGLASPNATCSTLLLNQYNAFLATKSISPVTTFPINSGTPNFWCSMSSTDSTCLAEFYSQKTVDRFTAMKSYLKNTLGVQCLVMGMNYLHSPLTNYWRSQGSDAYEMHHYYQWDVRTGGVGSGYYVYNPVTYRMLSDIFALIDTKACNTYPFLSLNQEYLKPFFLTEFHDVFPNPGRDQTALFVSSIGAFQGWDDLNRFCLGSATAGDTDRRVGAFGEFNMSADPIVLMSEYQGVLAFRTGNIKAAAPRFVIVRDKTYCKSNGNARWESPGTSNLCYLSYLYNTQNVYADTGTTSPLIYKITSSLSKSDIAQGIIPSANLVPITSTMSFLQAAQACISSLSDSDSTESAIKTMQQSYLNQSKLISETGEIVFDISNSVLTVNTPCVAAAAGTLNNAQFAFGQANLTISSTTTKGTLFAASLDKKPIGQSAHVLVINTTDAKATGATVEPLNDGTNDVGYRIVNATYSNAIPTASDPNLVLLATGGITYSTTINPLAFTAYRVGMNGARLSTIPFTSKGSQLSLGFDTSSGYAIELVSAPVFTDSDVGGPTLAGSASYNMVTDTYTVTGSGADVWNAADQLNYYSRTVSGNSIVSVARITTLTNAGGLSRVGIMLRDSTSTSAANAYIQIGATSGISFQYRNTNSGSTAYATVSTVSAPTAANPVWLKLVKNGNNYWGYYATGTSSPTVWNQVGSKQTITLSSSTPLLGLAVCSHNNSVLMTATADNVSITQVPVLTSADIGSPTPAGSLSYLNTYNEATGTYTLSGGGADIWNGADQFQYASQSVTGTNATAIVRVTSLTNTSGWAKTGLMFRDTSAAGSMYADVLATAGAGVAFQWRDITNGTSYHVGVSTVSAPTTANPVWLKLVRSGNSFSGYYATGTSAPTSWTQVGTTSATITFSGTSSLVGLPLTSHNNGTLCTGTLDNLTLTNY